MGRPGGIEEADVREVDKKLTIHPSAKWESAEDAADGSNGGTESAGNTQHSMAAKLADFGSIHGDT